MGQVCAKNDAGKVSTDAPRPKVMKHDKELMSQPAQQSATISETRYVASDINFHKHNMGNQKPKEIAAQVALEWCATNPGRTFTGKFKN